MRITRLFVFGCLILLTICLSVPFAVSENSFPIRIGEVQMNPDGSDTGAEFVELVNVSTEVQTIGGWELDAADLPYYTIPVGTTIQPAHSMVIYFRKDGVQNTESIFSGAAFGSTNMKNTNGAVALFNSSLHNATTIMDYVAYGATNQTHEAIAIERGLWQSGLYIPVTGTEGWSIMRICQRNLDSTCWKYALATPTVTTLDDLLLPTVNQNSNSGAIIPERPNAILYINEDIFTSDHYASVTSFGLRIHASSGAILHVDYGDGFREMASGDYIQEISEEGAYTISYFLNNDMGSFQSLSLEYHKITPPQYPYINEVSFNPTDDKKDFLEIYFPPSGVSFSTLQGFSLMIDQVLIPLDDVPISPDGLAMISFGDNRTDVDTALQKVVSSPTNLVSTTEQIALVYENTVVDGVCWETLPVSTTEVNEYHDFISTSGPWSGSCINATTVKTGMSLARKEQGSYPSAKLSQALWEIMPVETPMALNVLIHSAPLIVLQIQGDGKTSGTAPFHLNLTAEGSSDVYGIVEYLWDYGDGTTSTGANPLDHIYPDVGNYDVTLRVTNLLGDMATNTLHIEVSPVSSPPPVTSSNQGGNVCTSQDETLIILSEIFPNPKGVDTGAEWIELYNPTESTVILCDLWLDDEEGGSMPYALRGKEIAPKSYVVFSDTETKLVLGNTADMVRLLYGSDREVIDSVSYMDAREGMSYSRF